MESVAAANGRVRQRFALRDLKKARWQNKNAEYVQVKPREVFIYNDQPTTCPDCGARTEIVSEDLTSLDRRQTHRCPALDCARVFDIVEDNQFN